MERNIFFKIAGAFGLLIVVFVIFFHIRSQTVVQDGQKGQVIVGEKTFSVEIADTQALQALGLSGHAPLSDNQGMLFIFEKPAVYTFWMKDMKVSLDIIWIDENMKIVYIQKNARPESYPESFNPRASSLYVLEVSAGQADALKIGVGDSVKIVKN